MPATITPVTLNADDSGAVDAAGTVTTVTGWGLLEQGGSPTTQLQEVQVAVVSSEECDANYAGMIRPSMLCAGWYVRRCGDTRVSSSKAVPPLDMSVVLRYDRAGQAGVAIRAKATREDRCSHLHQSTAPTCSWVW